MTTPEIVGAAAYEFLMASGERTGERLRSLVDHYATVYGLLPEERNEALRQALKFAALLGIDQPAGGAR